MDRTHSRVRTIPGQRRSTGASQHRRNNARRPKTCAPEGRTRERGVRGVLTFLLGATRLEAGRFHVSGAAGDMMARAFGVRRTFARTVVGAKVSPRGTTSGLGAVLRTGELRDDAEVHTAGHRSPRPRGRCDQTLSALAVVQHDFACEFSAVIAASRWCTRSRTARSQGVQARVHRRAARVRAAL